MAGKKVAYPTISVYSTNNATSLSSTVIQEVKSLFDYNVDGEGSIELMNMLLSSLCSVSGV